MQNILNKAPNILIALMRNINVHNVCIVHFANKFMSSNISAPNHVNNVKGGNSVAVNCVVFVVN